MGKKRRQSKREREAKRNRAIEREVLSGLHVEDGEVVDSPSVASKASKASIASKGTVEDVREYDVSEISDSVIEDMRASSEESIVSDKSDTVDSGNAVDVRVSPIYSEISESPLVDSTDPVTPVRSDSFGSTKDAEIAKDTEITKVEDPRVSLGKGSLYDETFGAVWPDEPNRHRRVSVWAWVSGTMLTFATLGVLFGSLAGEDGSEKGRTIVSRPGEHKVVDSDFVFKGRSVKVEVVGGMITQTSENDLVKKVESVIARDAREWRTDTFKKTESMSREMKVYLMDGKTTDGMFEVYVDYSNSSVILLSEKGYVRLPDGVGKQIFNDLSKAGKYTD